MPSVLQPQSPLRFCCLQGFVLGQYGLLYALQHEDDVERLFILNTPLATNSKLRPELAAYKNPIAFLRPGNVSQLCQLDMQVDDRSCIGLVSETV